MIIIIILIFLCIFFIFKLNPIQYFVLIYTHIIKYIFLLGIPFSTTHRFDVISMFQCNIVYSRLHTGFCNFQLWQKLTHPAIGIWWITSAWNIQKNIQFTQVRGGRSTQNYFLYFQYEFKVCREGFCKCLLAATIVWMFLELFRNC